MRGSLLEKGKRHRRHKMFVLRVPYFPVLIEHKRCVAAVKCFCVTVQKCIYYLVFVLAPLFTIDTGTSHVYTQF